MPPQLRWFMRTTFMPAAMPFAAIPSMYCDSLEPSRPCTIMTVRRIPDLPASGSDKAPSRPAQLRPSAVQLGGEQFVAEKKLARV